MLSHPAARRRCWSVSVCLLGSVHPLAENIDRLRECCCRGAPVYVALGAPHAADFGLLVAAPHRAHTLVKAQARGGGRSDARQMPSRTRAGTQRAMQRGRRRAAPAHRSHARAARGRGRRCGTHMLMRMEPLWWQYMQSKLPITLGRAFLAAFFADLRFPMVVHPSPSLPAHEPSLPTKSLQSKGPEGRGLLAACKALCLHVKLRRRRGGERREKMQSKSYESRSSTGADSENSGHLSDHSQGAEEVACRACLCVLPHCGARCAVLQAPRRASAHAESARILRLPYPRAPCAWTERVR